MKKSLKIFNITLIITVLCLLSSCFSKGTMPDQLDRFQKLEEVKKQTENLDGLTKINGSVAIYLGNVKTSYSNMTYTIHNSSSSSENEVSYLEENYKLNSDPYGELYIKEVIEETFKTSDVALKLSISEYLVKDNFIDGIFSIYVSKDYATLHGNIEPDMIVKFIGNQDELSNIDKVSIDITCKNNKLDSYTIMYRHLENEVKISFSFIY